MRNRDRRLQSILDAMGPDAPAEGAGLVQRAYEWACEHHAAQMRRDGSTVLDHVVGVTENVVAAGSRDPRVLAAALLHDVVEKTPVTPEGVREEFGPRVAALVDAVTNGAGDDVMSSAERASRAGPDALLLRLCDRLDGVRRSHGRPAGTRSAYVSDARTIHLPLAEAHFPTLAEALREAIEAAERR